VLHRKVPHRIVCESRSVIHVGQFVRRAVLKIEAQPERPLVDAASQVQTARCIDRHTRPRRSFHRDDVLGATDGVDLFVRIAPQLDVVMRASLLPQASNVVYDAHRCVSRDEGEWALALTHVEEMDEGLQLRDALVIEVKQLAGDVVARAARQRVHQVNS
jgi:hypothetical protein